jgi:beta-lactamase regulating signal transducer with metallopeptidase domain
MSAIDTLLRQPAAQVMGWALLHFIWQGALIGALAAVALAALRRSAADVRYVVATIALSLMLTLPIVTAVQLWRGEALRSDIPRAAATSCAAGQPGCRESAIDAVTGGPASTPRAAAFAGGPQGAPAAAAGVAPLDGIRVEPWLPVLVLGWLCGVAVLTLRLMSGWLWVQRMKSHGAVPAGEGWQRIGARLSRRLHIGRRVRLLESTIVDVPTVIGWIKPVVLLPASALAGLSPEQLEAILAHELAHIRRHDYLVNLLQTLVETLLFYHPAVWWLSRRIRAERENCCDDLAVSLCGDPYTYAKALADLEELRGATGRLVMAANGGSLVARVRRLLGAPTHAGRAPGWLAGSATVLVMLGIVAGAAGTDAFQSPQASTPAQTASAQAPSEQLSPEDVAATTRAIEASAKALANDLKFTWDSVVHGARRSEAHVEMEKRARELTAAVAGLQAATAGQAGALQDQARATAVRAQTAELAALVDANRAVAVMEASRAVAALAAQSDALSAAATTALAAQSGELPIAAAALAPTAGLAIGGVQGHGTFSWSNNGEKLEVKYDGEVEFTDDDSDVKRLSPGGYLRIKDGGLLSGLFSGRTIEFTADGSGNVARRFWVGSSERPFEPEGRQWLAKVLPRFIRQTGLGAPARVARILKARGPAGVLAEISLIEGSWAKKTYFSLLLKTAALDSATVRQALAQAGREIDSDFELASLLIDCADRLLVDDAARQAYFEAARSIQSDFEMRRVYSSALKRGTVAASVLAAILDASRSIDSDFEEASLLIQIAKLQPLDNTTRAPFFAALATVDSDFEHRRVLSALAERTDLTPETTGAMLDSIGSVESDFESASFLLQIVKQQPIEGALRAPFFRALDSVGSSFERGRVLQAVARRGDASPETVLAVLRSTVGMNSSFEASQVLLAVAATRPLAGAARDAYIDAAEKLGDFEQGRVLAALVKNERRK